MTEPAAGNAADGRVVVLHFDKRAFPRGLKPCQFMVLIGAAEAAPFQSKCKLRSRALSKQVQTAKPRPFKASANCEAAPFQSKCRAEQSKLNARETCGALSRRGRSQSGRSRARGGH